MNPPELTPNSIPPELNVQRLTRSAKHFETTIDAAIQLAREQGREIDDNTAALIAHVLSRGLGRDSALAEYARTRTGTPDTLSAEYLRIYGHPQTLGTVRGWIDWLGTYLTTKVNNADFETSSEADATEGPQFLRPPKLLRSELTISGETLSLHLPPTVDGPQIQAIVQHLESLPLIESPAFRAFLTLPDVDGSATNLVESFHEFYVGHFDTYSGLIYALSPLEEWQTALGQWTAENGLPHEAVTFDEGIVLEQVREVYDILEKDGGFYAFNK
ncbi:hypothetical protein [Galbitalea soli]|uniref:Uncharacterized protein n=1 Tax=Galbitalea soli TaxID=1268042 RepID=A0A7C9PME1_9MICO|nr:hypothetical protein [Galbitalea soli]NEM90914.1 hypothetical protein [Galbitalea soli]NYJ31640.1 hypothetical protein [Galbitalea soli]